jgi:hypothetical protein
MGDGKMCDSLAWRRIGVIHRAIPESPAFRAWLVAGVVTARFSASHLLPQVAMTS